MRSVCARISAATFAVLAFCLLCAAPARAQKLPAQRSLLRVQPSPSTVFFGPILHVGTSIAANSAPGNYGVKPSLSWSAGVELSYKIANELYAGWDAFYARRSWEMSAAKNEYDELGLDYAAFSPFVRYRWAIVGVACMFPCATQAAIQNGPGDPTILQLEQQHMLLVARAGWTMPLWGDDEQEVRGIAVAGYTVNRAIGSWQLHSSSVTMPPIAPKMLSIQFGLNWNFSAD